MPALTMRALPEADLTADLNRQHIDHPLHHLTEAAHDQAIELLFADLNATQAIVLGTGLTLIFKLGSS